MVEIVLIILCWLAVGFLSHLYMWWQFGKDPVYSVGTLIGGIFGAVVGPAMMCLAVFALLIKIAVHLADWSDHLSMKVLFNRKPRNWYETRTLQRHGIYEEPAE